MPHRHTANPSQLSALILSPIKRAAKSRVHTSYRKTQNERSDVKDGLDEFQQDHTEVLQSCNVFNGDTTFI